MQFTFFVAFLACFLSTLAAPLSIRQEKVSNVKCTSTTPLDVHTKNVAILSICGGIAGAIQKCQGAPTSTTGRSGNAQFDIVPVVPGATINISKGRWEQGIRAAEAICGVAVPFTAVFAGGASQGDVKVTLKKV